MSWPADGEPRFKLTSVTGFAEEGGARQTTFYQVLDRAYCHELLLETPSPRLARWVMHGLESGSDRRLRYALRNREHQARYRAERAAGLR